MKCLLLMLVILLYSSSYAGEPFWERLNGPYTAMVDAMVLSPNGNIFIKSDNLIFRSEDNGLSWQRIYIVDHDEYFYLYDMVISSKGVLAILTQKNILFSFDNGDSWQPNDILPDVSSNWFIRFDNNENLLLVNNKSNSEFKDKNDIIYSYRSSDYGKSWQTNSFKVEGIDRKLKISHFEVGSDNSLTISAYDHLNSEYSPAFLLISKDSGSTFRKTKPIIGSTINWWEHYSPQEILVGCNSGIVYSLDSGNTWNETNCKDFTQMQFKINDNEILTETDSGMIYSNDRGRSWHMPKDNIQLNLGYRGTFRKAKDGTLYAGGYYGFDISRDNGKSWTKSMKGMTGFVIEELAFDKKGNIYAGLHNGLFKSTDNGMNWEDIGFHGPSGYRNIRIDHILINDKDEIVVSGKLAGFGTAKSTDGGKSWRFNTVRDLHGQYLAICSWIIKRNGDILAANPYDGSVVWHSTDFGDTWNKKPVDKSIYSYGYNKLGEIIAGGFLEYYKYDEYSDTYTTTSTFEIDLFKQCFMITGLLFNPHSETAYSDCFFKSTDNGTTWHDYLWSPKEYGEKRPIGSDSLGYYYTDSLNPVTQKTILIRSKTGRDVWEVVDTLPMLDQSKFMATSPRGQIFLYTYPNSLYRSRDFFISAPEQKKPSGIMLWTTISPIGGSTEIHYELPQPGLIRLDAYDIFGRNAGLHEIEYKDQGSHTYSFKTDYLSSGVYYIVLEACSDRIFKPIQIFK